MAEADCELCRLAGYRACDVCGGPVYQAGALGIDVCGYCRVDGAAGTDSSGRPAAASGASGPPTAAPAPRRPLPGHEWNTPRPGVGGAV